MNQKKQFIGLGIFALLIIGLVFVWANFHEQAEVGNKKVCIQVICSTQETEKYEFETDAQFLIEAMEDAKAKGLTFEAEEGAYGLSILSVNQERADYTKDGAYWSFYVNGEYCNYGVSQQPVEDGDVFEIVYTKAE